MRRCGLPPVAARQLSELLACSRTDKLGRGFSRAETRAISVLRTVLQRKIQTNHLEITRATEILMMCKYPHETITSHRDGPNSQHLHCSRSQRNPPTALNILSCAIPIKYNPLARLANDHSLKRATPRHMARPPRRLLSPIGSHLGLTTQGTERFHSHDGRSRARRVILHRRRASLHQRARTWMAASMHGSGDEFAHCSD